MSASKHFDKIAWAVTAVILIVVILFINGATLGISVKERILGYETRLFDNTRVHTIEILMDDWDVFIENAESEDYYTADVVIDGEHYNNVGIRGKGNTSLSMVSSMGSQRYSFKVEFDHYNDSLTYYGLDKLSLNNLIQDTTMMKDYLTYTLMNEFGAAAPLCSFVYITVNGEEWGLYLAVEGVEEGFLQRNYGADYGELYKPDSMSMAGGRGNGKDFELEALSVQHGGFGAFAETAETHETTEVISGIEPPQIQGNGEMPNISGIEPPQMQDGGMNGMGSSDVKLQYIDDNPESYSNIWDNAKTNVTEADMLRLIESLEKLSNHEELSSVVDIDPVIRYFVVHNYVCNGDSYTGSMVHNYYLYENNGQMSMIPWDYNLAFGTFQGGNPQSIVNTPIDSPISGGSGDDRPMWSWITSDDLYTDMYHSYFNDFLKSVDIQSIINEAYNLISSYVERDPTSFYTYEEFEAGVKALSRFCDLRSQSIYMQLSNNETVTQMDYVDATDLNLSDMGTMNGGSRNSDNELFTENDKSYGRWSGDIKNSTDDVTNASELTNEIINGPDENANADKSGLDTSVFADKFGAADEFPGTNSNGTFVNRDDVTNSDSSFGEDGSEEIIRRPTAGNMEMSEGKGGFPADREAEKSDTVSNPGSESVILVISIIVLCIGIFIAKKYKS